LVDDCAVVIELKSITLTWQEGAVATVLLLAVGYVLWRLVRFLRRKGMPDCGCCQSCSAESRQQVLVTLDAMKAPSRGGSPTATPASPTATPTTLKPAIPDDPGRRGAVGVAVRDGRMLVIRRSRSVVAPLVCCFPGGGIEPGESEEDALVREFHEEIGVAVRPVRRLWQCVTSWKVELAWWLVEMAPDATPVANPAEVESIYWYTAEEMAQLPDLLESNREFLEVLRAANLFSGTLP
jgi:8-oxo-dGTP diphosphatase